MIQPPATAAIHARSPVPASAAPRPTGTVGFARRLVWPPGDDRAAGIYVRISDDKEGAGLGVERQEQDARRLAEQRGYRVVEVYTDNDLSAYLRKKPRQAYLRLMDDLRSGRIGVVLVWHLDRLYRQPRELEDMIALCEQGERRVVSCYGDYDLSTPDGCFMARILVANANKESADKSRRVRRKMAELAENGKPGGGGRWYGYTKDLQIEPEEAEVIREAARRVLAGEGIRSIAADFHRRGIRSARGGILARNTLRSILMSGRISGQRDHLGVTVAKATWPAIITPEETERLRAVFRDPARRRPGRGVSYLLSGILRCGRCGARMVGRRHGTEPTYACVRNYGSRAVGCGGISRNAWPVDELVTEAVIAVLDGPDMARAMEGSDEDRGAQLMAQIAEEEAQRQELAAAYAAKQITMAEWLTARAPIEQRIQDLSVEFAATTRRQTVAHEYVGRGGALREDWGLLSVDQRRAIISSVIDHIVVEPAERGVNKFDPSRIKPIWKV